MPAPAVIPAPRAYINAVAVKGFVVELRAVFKENSKSYPSGQRPCLLQLVNIRNTYHGNVTCLTHAYNVCIGRRPCLLL